MKLWHWRRLLRVPWTERKSNQSILKDMQPWIHWRDWCWSWNSNTLATWCKESTHWKRPWCQDRLKAGGERGNRGWDGWLASTQWTWVWANSRRQRSLACYSPWVHKELDMTERLNNSNNHMIQKSHYACVLILDIRNQYPKEMKGVSWRDTCILIFIVTLFTIAKVWKQPKCLLTDEWIKKWICICLCVSVCVYIYSP